MFLMLSLFTFNLAYSQSIFVDGQKLTHEISGSIVSAEYPVPSEYHYSPNKVTILYFTANWCGICSLATKKLIELTEQTDEIQVIGIHATGISTEDILSFIDKKSINFPILYNESIGAKDLHPIVIASEYQGIPKIVVIDSEGVVRFSGIGLNKLSETIAATLDIIQSKKKCGRTYLPFTRFKDGRAIINLVKMSEAN